MQKRWLILLPVIFITYSLAYLDRANYSFGAAAGMAADLNISPNASTWLGALFFLGYFTFQVPGTLWAQRHSVRKLIFFGLIGWGAPAAPAWFMVGVGHAGSWGVGRRCVMLMNAPARRGSVW